jgi:hypothetical protein
MRKLTDEEKERLMNELIDNINATHTKFSYEMTVQEFAERVGYKHDTARKLLNKKVKAEEMAVRHIYIDGKKVAVYSVL